MTRARHAILVLAGLIGLGCAPGFASPSRLRTLRVMAVKKDKPYARPGDTVRLSILLEDAAHEAPRGVRVTWFGGCENPPGDLYAGCLGALAGVPLGGPSVPTVGEGLEFSVRLSDTIISRRAPPADPQQPPYGTAFVFFAACPGTLTIVPPPDPQNIKTLPVQCVDASGDPYGADDFVIGYTQISVYDGFTNANPVITGFTLDGRPVTPECIGPACVTLEARELGIGTDGGLGVPVDAGAGDGGVAPQDPCTTGAAGCLALCTKAPGDCPKHRIRVEVDPSSAEHDSVQEARDGNTLLEQMWINYYTDGSRFESDVKLLNDAQLGWNEDHEAKVSAPTVPGPFHVWAVVHDNRGGAEWARVLLSTRSR